MRPPANRRRLAISPTMSLTRPLSTSLQLYQCLYPQTPFQIFVVPLPLLICVLSCFFLMAGSCSLIGLFWTAGPLLGPSPVMPRSPSQDLLSVRRRTIGITVINHQFFLSPSSRALCRLPQETAKIWNWFADEETQTGGKPNKRGKAKGYRIECLEAHW